MIEKFIQWNPNKTSRAVLENVIEVLTRLQAQGYTLTLRQLYYQLIAGDLLPDSWKDKVTGSKNNTSSYKRLGNIVSQGRLSGILDWSTIEDRGRTVKTTIHWENPRNILNAAAKQFRKDKWINQDNFVFVMCEKDAVSNIIEPVCRRWDVGFMANKGYSSLSALYHLYWRMQDELVVDKKIKCIYVGDFDPSGIDMDRDIINRMGIFFQSFGEIALDFPLQRVALTKKQIKKYNPPENPAKVTDTRFKKYKELHGTSSWELDALDPSVLSEIIETAIVKYVDKDKFDRIIEEEIRIQNEIAEFADKWKD